jgi:hypothetical protein
MSVGSELGPAATGRREHSVAPVQEGLQFCIAKILQRSAELGHGHLVDLAEVHTSEEDYQAIQLYGRSCWLLGNAR